MNERDNELFEAELGRIEPARLPAAFQSRLNAALTESSRESVARPRSPVWRLDWSFWLRWLSPAAAVAVALLLFVSQSPRGRNAAPPAMATAAPMLKADQVEIDRQLLDTFDAVANLPDGEPVRFRFRQWMDAVTVRDSVRGVEVVERTPRIEVMPVSFATY